MPIRRNVCSLGIAGIAIAAFVGCDAHVEPLDEATQPILTSTLRPDTEGAWAECQLDEDDESGWARTHCPDPEPDGTPRVCSASFVSEEQDDGSTWCEVTALCNYECASDADCPAPQSGTVVPVCHFICYLPCADTSECPDGMTCHHEDHGDGPKDAQGLCRYVYHCP